MRILHIERDEKRFVVQASAKPFSGGSLVKKVNSTAQLAVAVLSGMVVLHSYASQYLRR